MEPNYCCFASSVSSRYSRPFHVVVTFCLEGVQLNIFGLSLRVCHSYLLYCPPPSQTQIPWELRWAPNWKKRCEYYIPRRGIITVSTLRFCATFSFHPFIKRPVLLQAPENVFVFAICLAKLQATNHLALIALLAEQNWSCLDCLAFVQKPKLSGCSCSALWTVSQTLWCLSGPSIQRLSGWVLLSLPVKHLIQTSWVLHDISVYSDFHNLHVKVWQTINCLCNKAVSWELKLLVDWLIKCKTSILTSQLWECSAFLCLMWEWI